MILNGYAILDFAATLSRLLLGILVVGIAIRSWREHAVTGERLSSTAPEDRLYLLFMLALLLCALNLLSWPLLYGVLQSYVGEWPGTMCIYGVTRVGTQSVGPARLLPNLLQALQWMKPLLVFGSGAWAVLHLLNRQTVHGPLTHRIPPVVVAVGLLAVVDSAAEAAYLVIPKAEVTPSSGCCFAAFSDPARMGFTPGTAPAARLWAMFYGIVGALTLMIFLVSGATARLRMPMLPLLVVGSVSALGTGATFLIRIAAPRLLHQPLHHCPYDLISQAPLALVAAVLFVWGAFSVGWAGVAAWAGTSTETQPFLDPAIRKLLATAAAGMGAALLLITFCLGTA